MDINFDWDNNKKCKMCGNKTELAVLLVRKPIIREIYYLCDKCRMKYFKLDMGFKDKDKEEENGKKLRGGSQSG